MGCAECLERPHLHLTETLSAELGLTTEGLLGDERVRADATCVHLVFDHVAEFEHVDDAYGSGLVEAFAGTAVVEICLSVAGYACLIGPVVEVVERGAVENRGGEFLAEFASGPSEYGLENLSEVHTGWHTQRVEADVDRSTVGEEGHVFLAHDARHDTFVTVTSGHFVAYADFALLGDVDFGHLHDARGKFVAN